MSPGCTRRLPGCWKGVEMSEEPTTTTGLTTPEKAWRMDREIILLVSGIVLCVLYASPNQIVWDVLGEDLGRHALLFLAAICWIWTIALALSRAVAVKRLLSWIGAGLVSVPAFLLLLSLPYSGGVIEAEIHKRALDTGKQIKALSSALTDGHRRMGTLPPELKMATEDRDLRDVFSREKEDIRWWRFNENEGLLLSVGPDHMLNSSAEAEPLVYSPTNGTKSSGDIIHWVSAPMPTMP